MPRKLLLKNFQSPGDIVMLTAAVRAIHDCCPGDFLTDVRTSCPDLWSNNPYITPLEEAAPDVHTIECHYPLIHQSGSNSFADTHSFAVRPNKPPLTEVISDEQLNSFELYFLILRVHGHTTPPPHESCFERGFSLHVTVRPPRFFVWLGPGFRPGFRASTSVD